MTHDPRKPAADPGFESDLEAVQSAWDDMGTAEPPELLDQAVRNAARRDLDRHHRKNPLRWLGGFATATVVVLAVSLFLLQDSKPPAVDESLRLEKSALPQAEPLAPARTIKREATEPRLHEEVGAGAPAESDRAPREGPAAETGQLAAPFAATEARDQMEAMDNSAKGDAAEAQYLSPEAWIEELRALKERGETEALAKSLKQFTETWPDYPLPPDLAGYLP